MKTSENGIILIKKHEGFRAKAYQCPGGVWTIGYGTTTGVTKGMTIDEAQAAMMLKSHLIGIEKSLNILDLKINQNQFDALVSFIYNVGIGAFSRSGLCAMIKANPNSANIPFEFRKWNKSNGRVLDGLINRREDEIKLYQS